MKAKENFVKILIDFKHEELNLRPDFPSFDGMRRASSSESKEARPRPPVTAPGSLRHRRHRRQAGVTAPFPARRDFCAAGTIRTPDPERVSAELRPGAPGPSTCLQNAVFLARCGARPRGERTAAWAAERRGRAD